MTRIELQNELKKLDCCIEILHDFITKPLCKCIPHLGGFNESFREQNKTQLAQLISIKDALSPLTNKTDAVLQRILHQPTDCY